MQRDTLDKVVLTYFAAVTRERFTWRGVEVEPLPLLFGPNLLRGFTCLPNCGGCCPRFSLDYLPTERAPDGVTERVVEVSGRPVVVLSDLQDDHRSDRCRHLRPTDGLCGIHGHQPFSCDFELVRFFRHRDHWRVYEALFGRGWNMKRTDGGVGAYCTVDPATRDTALDVARRLDRLAEWADHFGIAHRATVLADYCRLYADDPADAPHVRLLP